MKSLTSHPRWIVAALASLVAFTSSAQELTRDELQAVVEQNPITAYDVTRTTGFRERMEVQRILNSSDNAKREMAYEALKSQRSEALERLIDMEVVHEEFLRKKFRLPDELVMRRIDRRVAIEAGGDWDAYEASLRDAGRTMEDLKEDVRKIMAVDLYLAQQVDRKIIISPADVFAHYHQNRELFRKPAEIRLQTIVINRAGRDDQAIQKRIDQVASGLADNQDFLSLAQKYSDSPGKDTADDLEWLHSEEIIPAFRDQLKNLRKGEVTGPFDFQERSIFLKVADTRGGAIPPFDEVREDVRNELFAIERRRRYEIVMDNLRRQTFVRRLDDTQY